MSLSDISNLMTIAGFVLFASLTLIDRWPQIMHKDNTMLQKLALGCLILAIVGWGVGHFLPTGESTNEGKAPLEDFKSMNKIPVINKEFMNERVLLDGHSYSNCVFRNVKFIYNGTAPFDLSHNDIYGPIVIKSENPKIEALLYVLRELQFFRKDLVIIKPR